MLLSRDVIGYDKDMAYLVRHFGDILATAGQGNLLDDAIAGIFIQPGILECTHEQRAGVGQFNVRVMILKWRM